jgi:hypothetical protein
VVVATLMSDSATGAGLIAASIAVGGFLLQLWPALAKREEQTVRAAAAVGGVAGLFFGASIIAAEVW